MVDWVLVLSFSIPVLIPTSIYIVRQIKTRQRVAKTILNDIEKNESTCAGLRRHLVQVNIVPGQPQNERERISDQELIRIQEGLVPPASRFSTVGLQSGGTEISKFDVDTADDVYNYYRDVDYVMGLIDSIHDGVEMPPAAYTLLESRFDTISNCQDELKERLRIEMRWSPRLFRVYLAMDKFFHCLDRSIWDLSS